MPDQMKTALVAAGKEAPQERLHRAARAALAVHGKNYWLALDLFLSECDRAMLKLIPGLSECVLKFLAAEQMTKAARDHCGPSDKTKVVAQSIFVPSGSAAGKDRGRFGSQRTHASHVTPRRDLSHERAAVALAKQAERPSVGAARKAARGFGEAFLGQTINRGISTQKMVNGKPLLELTKLELDRAFFSKMLDPDFYAAISDRLPVNARVADYWTAKELDDLWTEMKKSHAA